MRATNLYVFKAGDMYALTIDETGSNLPKSSSGEWLRFGDTTTIDLAEVLPHALDDVAERGFCLLEQSPTKPPSLHGSANIPVVTASPPKTPHPW